MATAWNLDLSICTCKVEQATSISSIFNISHTPDLMRTNTGRRAAGSWGEQGVLIISSMLWYYLIILFTFSSSVRPTMSLLAWGHLQCCWLSLASIQPPLCPSVFVVKLINHEVMGLTNEGDGGPQVASAHAAESVCVLMCPVCVHAVSCLGSDRALERGLCKQVASFLSCNSYSPVDSAALLPLSCHKHTQSTHTQFHFCIKAHIASTCRSSNTWFSLFEHKVKHYKKGGMLVCVGPLF